MTIPLWMENPEKNFGNEILETKFWPLRDVKSLLVLVDPAQKLRGRSVTSANFSAGFRIVVDF